PVAEYEKLLAKFNPVKFNADEFARIAQDAGMRYMVITSKHHDGFCLFDSKETDWDIMSTPFKRDLMKELSQACNKLGAFKPGERVKVGSQPVRFAMYHSIMDWHHPDYLPRRPWEKANRPETGADFERFVKYLKAQLAEITAPAYDPGLIWFDGEWEGTWTHERGEDLAKYMRKIAPSVIVNNRIDKGRAGMDGETKGADFLGDYHTPEQTIPERGLPGDWETCMTMNGNWGYNAADRAFKTSEDLIKKLCDIASKGGNFLLNVGPTAEGEIPPDSVRRLHEMGEWMRVNGDSIYGTVRSPLPAPPAWGRVTMKKTTSGALLYLMVFDPPKDGKLVVGGLLNEPGRVWLLQNERSSVRTDLQARATGGQIEIDISKIGAGALTGTAPVAVYALEIKGEPDPTIPPTINAFADTFVDSVDVSFACERKNCEIRVTTDGKEPTAASALAGAPIKVTATTTVAARGCRAGKAVSPTVKRSFTKVP
ncbi:MAG: alpha-L-fucosidase, partial [Planctomycetota bacterium]